MIYINAYLDGPLSNAFIESASENGLDPKLVERQVDNFIDQWQKKNPHWLVNPIRLLKENPKLGSLMEKLHILRAQRMGISESLIKRIFQILYQHSDDPEAARKAVYRQLPSEMENGWRNRIWRRSGSDLDYNQVKPYLADLQMGSVVADIGTGLSGLGQNIARDHPWAHVVSTDLDYVPHESSPDNFEFVIQPGPTNLPFEDASVDVVILSSVLHHVSQKARGPFLKEVYRVLKGGGKVILREDSYSREVPIETKSDVTYPELTQELLSLDEDTLRGFYIFSDWFNNILATEHTDTPMPYNFYSLEEWEEIFYQYGFKHELKQFYGLPFTRGLMVLNKTALNGQTPKNTPIIIDQPTRQILIDQLSESLSKGYAGEQGNAFPSIEYNSLHQFIAVPISRT